MMMILTTMMMRFDPPPTCPTVQCLRSPQGFRKLWPPGMVEVMMMLIIITLFNTMKGMIVNYDKVSVKQPLHVPEQK